MLGAAAGSGNGEDEWDDLADQAKNHSTAVREHARKVGPGHDPSQDLVNRLNAVDAFLVEVLILVDHVRARIDQELASEAELNLVSASGLSTPLRALGESLELPRRSIKTVQDALFRYTVTLRHELDQRAVEGTPGSFRDNRRFEDDQVRLHELSEALEKSLVNLAGHLDMLQGSLPT
jgi:hypothetical protein